MPPEMNRFLAWCFLVWSALCVSIGVAGHAYAARDRTPPPAIAVTDTVHVIRQAKTDTVRAQVRTYVDRWRTDTAWQRDTVTLRDTVFVRVPLSWLSSTITACAQLDTAIGAERTACDQAKRSRDLRIRDLERKQVRDRFGICAGYGLTAAPDGTFTHGVQVGACIRIRP